MVLIYHRYLPVYIVKQMTLIVQVSGLSAPNLPVALGYVFRRILAAGIVGVVSLPLISVGMTSRQWVFLRNAFNFPAALGSVSRLDIVVLNISLRYLVSI